MTPTARTLAALRAEGWTAEVVERWNPYARVRHDLFNVAGILAVRGAETLPVQVTSGSNVPARVHKLTASSALPLLVSVGWRVEAHVGVGLPAYLGCRASNVPFANLGDRQTCTRHA